MYEYYSERLSGERLKQVYEIAPARIRRYLDAEVDHVLGRMEPGESVLDLGCGYGRILPRLADKAGLVVGIDTSLDSLLMGQQEVSGIPACYLICMDAVHLAFKDATFGCVVCVQNGISAFHVDRTKLLREAVRVTRPGGRALFSTYSADFWEERLAWFGLQARAGLIGEIDYEKSHGGDIVCKDGFTAGTLGRHEFLQLARSVDAKVRIDEVDGSSLFCEVVRR
jgi:2-polyprenyl-6-hydroxyphenyl methylase/3-demethylubiquinone-9 3-methyltransferase